MSFQKPVEGYPLCQTCRHFYVSKPMDVEGMCQKEPSEWPTHWLLVWDTFGCVGHQPKEAK